MTFATIPRLTKRVRRYGARLAFVVVLACAGGQTQARPIFQVFELLPSRSDSPEVAFDENRPLLTVRSIRDVKADYEHSSVRVTLKGNDAKAFASLTREFTGRLLLLRATETAMEVMRITGPMENGKLSFDALKDAPLFDYLSERFRLAPQP